MSKTTIINLYGGPGAGKSTAAAYLFFLLKTKRENAELVREYVKEWVWSNRSFNQYDQLYFLGKQARKESLLYGKVNYIVTDAPVMMNAVYAHLYCTQHIASGVQAATLSFYRQAAEDGHKHVHIFLNRHTEYDSSGRYQTEEEAKTVDCSIKNILKNYSINYQETTSSEEDLLTLLQSITGEI